jgi:outer membrane lipoprotein-sorting protein
VEEVVPEEEGAGMNGKNLLAAILVSVSVSAQSVEDANELLQRVRSFAENTKNWRVEVVEKDQIAGFGISVPMTEVRIKIAAESPLKMIRQDSGDDQTIFVCDGVETFYSGDGHSYYHQGKVNPQCDLPLSKFYELDTIPTSASLSVVGRDHVGDKDCVVVRITWKQDKWTVVRTLCIDPDPARPLILRDVAESEQTGLRAVKTTTYSDFESNPTFPPDTFRFSIPPGAVEAKPPI